MSDMESYQVCAGPADQGGPDDMVIVIQAEHRDDALFRAGIVAMHQRGPAAGDYIVKGCVSQAEFMADHGARAGIGQGEPEGAQDDEPGWFQSFMEDGCKDAPMVTKTGRVLTDSDIEELSAEAERGYDLPAKPLRRAHVTIPRHRSIEDMSRTVDRYLPRNYHVAGVVIVGTQGMVVVEGTDNAGWTMDGYVLPRLGSGMISAREVAVTEATEAAMPAEPEPGHKYAHESGDCSCF